MPTFAFMEVALLGCLVADWFATDKLPKRGGCITPVRELFTSRLRIPVLVVPMLHTVSMTFANVGSLGTKPGQRDAVVSILLRPMAGLKEAGCLLYEVGVNDEAPDTVFVSELWESPEAHQASLQLDSVRAAIAEAMPLLSGEMGGNQFTVLGSPLR
jgi:quinol monooxygenase YgiN